MPFYKLRIIGKAGQVITVLIGLLFLFSFAPALYAATYFVDATNGRDTNNGLSEATGWKTIAKVNATTFQPGDQVLFKRGEVWRDQLNVPSSGVPENPITFRAYGSGAKPRISGADLVTGMVVDSANIWKKSGMTRRPTLLYVNTVRGTLRTSKGALASNNDWSWDSGTDTLYLYSTTEPSGKVIEAGQRDGVIISGRSDITIDGLALDKGQNPDYGSGVWIYGTGTTRNRVLNCDIYDNVAYGVGFGTYPDVQAGHHEVGYCKIYNNGPVGIKTSVRSDGSGEGTESWIHHNEIYGNISGIVVSANYWIIEYNYVHDNGDHTTAYGTYGIGVYAGTYPVPISGAGTHNIIRYNLVRGQLSLGEDGYGIALDSYTENNQIYYNIAYGNDGGGFYINNASKGGNSFYNNVSYGNCLNTSGQLTKKGEFRVTGWTDEHTANYTIKNNIAVSTQANTYAIYIDQYSYSGTKNITNNLWYASSTDWYFWKATGGNSLSTWNGLTGGADRYSDPLFVSPSTPDFHCRANSPAIDAGTDVGLAQDYEGNPVQSPPDIGAYQTRQLSAPTGLRITTVLTE